MESMELKVISCMHLKAFNFFQKLSVYAVVSITSDVQNKISSSGQKQKVGERVQRQKTPVDRDANGNPEWNHRLRFDLNHIISPVPDHYLVKFSLRCEGIVYGNKTIGEVCVPLKDLIDDQFNGAVRFVSYQVRTTDGKPNGVLNFSYKISPPNINDKGNDDHHLPPPVDTPKPLPPPSSSMEVEVEEEFPKKKSFYPSLDISALPAITFSTPYRSPELYNKMPLPQPQPQPQPQPPQPPPAPMMMDVGGYYHYHHHHHPHPWYLASQPSYDQGGLCRYPSGLEGGMVLQYCRGSNTL